MRQEAVARGQRQEKNQASRAGTIQGSLERVEIGQAREGPDGVHFF